VICGLGRYSRVVHMWQVLSSGLATVLAAVTERRASYSGDGLGQPYLFLVAAPGVEGECSGTSDLIEHALRAIPGDGAA
jgi:hypothetical protein